MSAIVLQSTSIMITPGAAPTFPDIDSGLRLQLKAADLAGANGDTIASWIARGSADVTDRTFDKLTVGTNNWVKPKLSLAGGPLGGKAVLLDKFAQLGNLNTSGPAQRATQPLTYAAVFKVNAFTNNLGSRLIGGTTTFLQNVRFGSSVPGAVNIAAQTSYQDFILPGEPTAWGIMIWSFNGAQGKLKLRNDPVISGLNFGLDPYAGFMIGGQASGPAAGTGMDGAVAEIRQYGRAFSDIEFDTLHLLLAREYGLA